MWNGLDVLETADRSRLNGSRGVRNQRRSRHDTNLTYFVSPLSLTLGPGMERRLRRAHRAPSPPASTTRSRGAALDRLGA
eukprot:1443165-Pyramimonas_sp.AAC.1